MLEIYRELATFERLPPPDEEESVRLGAMIFDAGRLEGLVAEEISETSLGELAEEARSHVG